MEYIVQFFVAAIIFAGIDLVWLGVIAKQFYRDQMGSLFAKKIKNGPAIAFYTMFIIGLLFFALRPALDADSALAALGYGAFFGFITYGTYDLTNWATTEKWPAKLAMVDLAWGTFLSAATTTLTFLVISAIS